ncbi:MAG: uncharacterized membrane protein YkvA (DUF1232 family) [Algoriphagus sp.]|jgi:uncharacterized membrane protein YkvA (DUF1232 family)
MSDNSRSNLISKILDSFFFKNSLGKAGRISKNSQSLLALIKKVLNKSKDLGLGGAFDVIRDKVVTIGSLLKSYASGEYRDIEVKNLVLLIASLVYFLSPIDLIPDFLPFLGYADDIALLTYILNGMGDEIEKFELWEMNKHVR